MSVVKKYQAGGPVSSDLESFIIKKLGETKLTSKAAKYAEEAASRFRDLDKAGKLKEAYSFDPIKHEYAIDLEKVPEHLKGYEWAGSTEAPSKNVFGQYSVKSDKEGASEAKKYNSLIAGWVGEYLGSATPTEKPINSGVNREFANLEDYIVNTNFGNTPEAYAKYREGQSNEDIKKDVMKYAAEHISNYDKLLNENLGKPEDQRDIFKEVKGLESIKKSLESGNWDVFSKEALKLGWMPSSLLKSDQQTAAEKAALDAGKVEEATQSLQEEQQNIPLDANAPAYVAPTTSYGIPQSGAMEQIVIPELDIDSIIPKIEERSIETPEAPAVVNKIYNDIVNGYSIDSGILGQIKWLWKNKEILPEEQQKKIKEIIEGIQTPNLKFGGIIKLQTGDKVQKLKVKIASGNTLHNLFSSPMTAEKGFGTLSTAGDVASFIPGIGAIGGAVTTVSDIAKDIAKDGFQASDILNWNTAANLGFTALAAVGMGGLKGTLKLAKAAKVADEAIDVSKAIGKMGTIGKDLNAAEDLVKLTSKIKNPTASTITGAISNLTGKEKAISKLLGREVKAAEIPKLKEALADDFKNILISENKTSLFNKGYNVAGKVLSSSPMKIASQTAVAGQVIPSITAIGKESFTGDGRLGNISLEDVGNVAKAGVIGKNYFKNKQGLKAIERQTISTKEPAKSAITITDAEGNVIVNKGILPGELPEKGKLTGLKRVWGRTKAKETINNKFNKEVIDKYKAITKQTIPEGSVVSSIDAISPEQLKNLSLKVKPSALEGQGLEKARKEFDLAKKILEKHGMSTIAKTTEEVKTLTNSEKKFISKLSGKLKQVEPELRSIEKEWKGKPKKFTGYNTRVKNLTNKKDKIVSKIKEIKERKEGGVLKMSDGGGFWDNLIENMGKNNTMAGPYVGPINIPIKKEVWKIPIQPFPVGISSPNTSIVPQVEQSISSNTINSKVNDRDTTSVSMKPLTSIASNINTTFPINNISNKLTIKNTKTGSIFPEKASNENLKNIINNINTKDVLNAGMYGKTLSTNDKVASLQKKAALAGIINIPTLSKQYFRATSSNMPFYTNQASKLTSIGKNMQESTSDLDKGFGARLAAASKGVDILEKGQLADKEQIQKTIAQQMGSDQQTAIQNLGIMGQNLQSVAGAQKAMSLVDANKLLANNAAFNNLVTATNRNKEIREEKGKYSNLFKLMTSPEQENLTKQYKTFDNEANKAKLDWEARVAASEKTSAPITGEWEKSPEYTRLLSKKDLLDKQWENYANKIKNSQLALQYGVTPGSFAKGGSLEEKVYLLNLKNKYRQQSDNDKQYFKSILHNNEMMVKSLIKIFK